MRRILRFVFTCLLLFGSGILSAQVIQATWTTQADHLRGKQGERFTFLLPPGGPRSGRLWGTNLYTDDSSIGLAAVHAGLITPEHGGTVTIEIRPGVGSYAGSTRHGVTSQGYGGWHGSFTFVGTRPAPPTESQVIQGTWTTQADGHRSRIGERLTFTFPGGGPRSGRLWGTDLYTDDSSIALAAVHAGLITPEHGGTVTIEIRPGVGSYTGSTRHGATSQGYGGWHGSFVFIR